jgi:uncharacterized protein (DUF2141 family)
MRSPTFPLAAFLLLATGLTAFQPLAQQVPLQVEIVNVQQNKGKIMVALYKDKSDWLKKPFRLLVLSTDKTTQTAVLAVPPGRYGVSVFQDLNGNGELDQNFLGIPKEPVGFGNNYRPMGKPSFEATLIEHNSKSKPEPIKLFKVL